MTIIRRAIFPYNTASVLTIWREFVANSPVNLDYQRNDAGSQTCPANMQRLEDAFYLRSMLAASRVA